jgi:hypothetical protein
MSDRTRHYLASAFTLVGLVSLFWPSASEPAPDDTPTGIVLAGKFNGPTAAEDSACIAALCDELGHVIQQDGEKEEPRLKSGVQFDELRVVAREYRTRGVSIGDRQPRARDEIKRYMEAVLGVKGGPVTPEQRAKWVDAFFEISKAATNATK